MSGFDTVVAQVPGNPEQVPVERVPVSRSYTRAVVSTPEPVSLPSVGMSATERLV